MADDCSARGNLAEDSFIDFGCDGIGVEQVSDDRIGNGGTGKVRLG